MIARDVASSEAVVGAGKESGFRLWIDAKASMSLRTIHLVVEVPPYLFSSDSSTAAKFSLRLVSELTLGEVFEGLAAGHLYRLAATRS